MFGSRYSLLAEGIHGCPVRVQRIRYVSLAPQFTRYTVNCTSRDCVSHLLTYLVVYIIARCSSLNTTTFCLFPVCPVLPHPTRYKVDIGCLVILYEGSPGRHHNDIPGCPRARTIEVVDGESLWVNQGRRVDAPNCLVPPERLVVPEGRHVPCCRRERDRCVVHCVRE